MAVNYNDKRFAEVESAKKDALNNANTTYDQMINGTDAQYNELIQANKDYATQQQQIQQENTNFAIEQINQQKDKAEKDYTKEQTAAYTDYQKATNQYGVGAEQQANAGLQNTGFAESSKVQAFTSYQNRYATAREVYNNAVLSYDNAIKDAQLKNNAQLAEIAFQSLQKQLEYALQGFQYKNQLLQTKLNTQLEIDNEYNNRYQQVLAQINTENSLAEQIRQFNEQMALEKQQFAWQKAQASSGGSSGGSSSGSKGSSTKTDLSKNESTKTDLGSDNSNAWVSSREMANSLGLPATVKLENVLSDKEYEKKVVNGIGYWRKK